MGGDPGVPVMIGYMDGGQKEETVTAQHPAMVGQDVMDLQRLRQDVQVFILLSTFVNITLLSGLQLQCMVNGVRGNLSLLPVITEGLYEKDTVTTQLTVLVEDTVGEALQTQLERRVVQVFILLLTFVNFTSLLLQWMVGGLRGGCGVPVVVEQEKE